MTQDGHILWPMIDTNMGSILIHDNIQPPMQLILDMPMRTNPLCKCPSLRRATADEIACFLPDTRPDLSLSLNYTNALYVIPRITGREM